MAKSKLEEVSVVDKIEVLLDGTIQVRRRDQVLKDGVEIAATYHRHVLVPGDDVSNEDPRTHTKTIGEFPLTTHIREDTDKEVEHYQLVRTTIIKPFIK